MKKIGLFIFIIILDINVWAANGAVLNNIKVNGSVCECTPVVGAYECVKEVDSNNVTITYEKDEDVKSDRASGISTPLTTGENSISITVTGKDNSINVYNFIITKHVKSEDYSLSKLMLNDKEIALLEDVYVYSAQVLFSDEKVIVVPTLNDTKAMITNSSLTYDFPLEESSKLIEFEVKAESGDTKNYRIVLTRSERPITTLNSLKIDKGYLNFKQDIFNYEVKVDYAVTDLIIEAIPNDENATVKINKNNLEVGENIITIEINNEKAQGIYTIKVIREPNLDKSLANLETLKIKELSDFQFDPNILDYNLKFDNIPSILTIKATSKSSDGLIEIINNDNLKNNSVVEVKVTLKEMEIERVYRLNIIQIEGKTINKIVIIVLIIILLIVMIVLFVFQFKGNKRKKITRRLIKKEEDIEII